MPSESSVVSSLIRDLNTRRLPSEPGDSVLFQLPKPRAAQPAAQPVRSRPAARGTLQLAPARAVPAPAATAPQPSRAKSTAKKTGSWWQFAVALLFIGGWAYIAVQLDSQEDAATDGRSPSTIVAASMASAAALPPAAVVAPAAAPVPTVVPAPAAQPAPPVVETPPTVEPTVAAAPPVEITPQQPAPAKRKHHRRHAAAKPAASAPAPVVHEAAEPAPPAPPPPPRAPAKPMRQSDDTENPLH